MGGEKVQIDKLVPKLKAMAENNPNLSVIISGDKKVSYGVVIQIMARLKAAGFEHVGLKTKIPGSSD